MTTGRINQVTTVANPRDGAPHRGGGIDAPRWRLTRGPRLVGGEWFPTARATCGCQLTLNGWGTAGAAMASRLEPRCPRSTPGARQGSLGGDGTWDQHPSASSEHPTAVFRSLQAPRNPGVPLMWGSPPGGGQRHGQPGRGATQATVTSSHRRLPEQPVDPPIDCALGISGHRPSTHRLLPRWTLSHYGEPVWDAGAAGHRLPPSPAKSY